MALIHEVLGHVSPEPWAPAARPGVVLPDSTRDNVGFPDFATLAARLTPDTVPVEELHGFAAYSKAGGVYSEVLYEAIMDGVINLQEPGEREKRGFHKATKWQIKGFEDRHNKPFLGTELPPEKQIFLTDAQKDAYFLVREGHISFPEEDKRQDPFLSDGFLFEQILKMPGLESYKLSKQRQPQTASAAA